MQRGRCATILISVVTILAIPCPGPTAEPHATLGDFYREQLLARFDRNADGRLDEQETTQLRESFGGIDVPMLPTIPFEYVKSAVPRHLASELAELDNSPADNPLTNPGALLGRVLFYDRQLSRNNKIACASCHEQQRGFADPRRFSVGYQGGKTGRNAMSLVNLRYSNLSGGRAGFFWDERAPTLEAQALMPIQDPIEMGLTLDELAGKLPTLPFYPPLFSAAFGSDRATGDRVGKAIAQFLRVLESWDSKFDRAARGGERLSDQESLGKSLFIDGIGGVAEFGCAHCHVPPTFGMSRSFNNGLDVKYSDRGLGALTKPPNDPFTPSNDGKFKAPSLRNVALTAPYMHDGRFETLAAVVDHYSDGVQPHENLGLAFPDGEPAPGKPAGFKFTAQQKAALVAFLKTLTDERFTTDPRLSDPFVR